MSETGVYSPDDIKLIQRVFEHLASDGLLPTSSEKRETLVRQALTIYSRGVRDEEQLLSSCKAFARMGYRLAVEDEPQTVNSHEGIDEAVRLLAKALDS